jgi:LPS-assembly protein
MLLLLMALSGLALPVLAADQPRLDSAAPVDLEADQLNFDEARGLYHAQGKARLSQGALRLTSDQIWWNQQTGEVEAAGDVRITAPGEELAGERISYNLQHGTGVVDEGSAYWQEKALRLSGRRLERLGPDKFRVYDGRYTLCDGERPAWSLGSTVTDVTIGRYLTAKHALVYVKDIPVFYLPYVVVPVKTERESGLLIPSIGFSDRRGTEFSSAWYQVLGRNMDATFYLDHLSKLGTGTGIEYRYIFGRSQRGEFNAYSVFARDGGDRWRLDWRHFGQLTENLRLVVDAEYVNERDYFEDYAEISGEYNEQKVVGSLFINQRWSKASLTAQVKSIKDLETDDPLPWRTAPLIDFSIAPWRLAKTPFYLGLESSYTNFRRREGTTGQRLMLRPTLGLHSFLFRGIEFDSEYSYRGRTYFETGDGSSDSSGASAIRARLSSRLSRVFGGGQRSWLHSIEPEINYNFNQADTGDELPLFDRYDRELERNSLGYALTTRLTGKWLGLEGATTQRELVWLKLSQDYDLDAQGDDEPFTDLRTQLTLRPTTRSSMTFDFYYDMESERIPDFTIDGNLSDGKGNGLDVTYHKRRPESGLGKIENLNFTIDTAVLKPLYLHYEQRYDLLESNRLEQVLSLDLRQQCWGIKTVLREREEDRSVMLVLTLSGLGEVGRFGRTYDEN